MKKATTKQNIAETSNVLEWTMKIPEIKSQKKFSDLLYLIESRKISMFPVPKWIIVAASILIVIAGTIGGIKSNENMVVKAKSDGIVYYSSQNNADYSGVVYTFSENQ